MSSDSPVLLIAYACNPYHGSEPGVGWGWVTMLAPTCRLTVLTAEFNRQDIERIVADDAEKWSNTVFVYVPHRPWHFRPSGLWRIVEHSFLKPIMNLAYSVWQKDAFQCAAKLHERERFYLTHLLTYVGFRFPGRFYQLDLPLVWDLSAVLRILLGAFYRHLGCTVVSITAAEIC